MDFVKAATRVLKGGIIEVYPKFLVKPTKDLMIRGHDFYAMWLEKESRWTTDEYEVIDAIDDLLREKAEQVGTEAVAYMWDADTKSIDKWHTYCQKQQHDHWTMLDSKLLFDGDECKKEDYVTKKLPYRLEEGDISAYEELISTLYRPDERRKIEWMIGSILSGDSRKLQKLFVFYGAPGTGKSTVINIIQDMFPGYWAAIELKSVVDKSNQFALEQFKSNPLIAIDHDSRLDKIEDNSRLNSIVSHEAMSVREIYKSPYQASFQSIVILATNKPVQFTDSKSGMIRRLIDINPSGEKLQANRYHKIMNDIKFELGAIAKHCLSVYLDNTHLYDEYEAHEMMSRSNDFYYFMTEKYFEFAKENEVTLEYAYNEYKKYCEESSVYPLKKKDFKVELGDYFSSFEVRKDGKYNVYSGFLTNKFNNSYDTIEDVPVKKSAPWLSFDNDTSLFDTEAKDYPAQLTKTDGTPLHCWRNVKTTLKELDTTQLHFVKVPENHIVIDFDLTDEQGKKSFEKNLEAALQFPPTYAELSKSGQGIHLHYIYTGDVSKLSRIYGDKIEVKVFTGDSSLRRKLSKCNNLPIKPISSNLPLKGDTTMLQPSQIKDERHLRVMIRKCLNKEYGSTVCCIDFIAKLLQDAYDGGLYSYDISDMSSAIYTFAANSTHQSSKCLKTYAKMKMKSKDAEEGPPPDSGFNNNKPIVFFDIEIFPNLFLVRWKEIDNPLIHKWFNPSPEQIKTLIEYRLIGFNNLNYDNHMLYAAILGYSVSELYTLSQRIIGGARNAKFWQANSISYSDVYDFASAANKMSLKKWEIKLHIDHQELGLPWDQPVPEELWEKVAEYCGNDVIATEAVFKHLAGDWMARIILADIAGMTVNDTTNNLTKRIVFGDNKHPQSEFNYRHMGEMTPNATHSVTNEYGTFENIGDPEWTWFDEKGRPIFKGYTFENGHSLYRGIDPKEGGWARGIPGIYYNAALLDIQSMHPSSIIDEELFGPRYTPRFKELKMGRVYIKHSDWDKLATVLDGKVEKYIAKVQTGEIKAKDLSNALKTAINAAYGLTSAKFDNEFKDPRNVDNIVAKRGSLFMINLVHEVEARGFTVFHVKTDSVKIADATPEIIEFVMNYGKAYGYLFEHEATYDRVCIVNDAVYVAKDAADGHWTATGAEFQVPYVFKKLFSHEDIEMYDLAETKSATSAIYIDKNEANPNDHNYQFVGKVGLFSPIKPGFGGGILTREAEDKEGKKKYDSLTGTKGYRWLETCEVIEKGLQDAIDESYYIQMVNEAIEHISQYGDFYAFVA